MIALGDRKTIALELHVPIIDGAAAVYMKMRSNKKYIAGMFYSTLDAFAFEF
jgi:hypothetical protein